MDSREMNKGERAMKLYSINVETPFKAQYGVRLYVDGSYVELSRTGGSFSWLLHEDRCILSPSKITLTLEPRFEADTSSSGRKRPVDIYIDAKEISTEASKTEDTEISLTRSVPLHGETVAISFLFRSSKSPEIRSFHHIFSPCGSNAGENGKMVLKRSSIVDPKHMEMSSNNPEILRGHFSSVMGIAYSPDARYIASASADTSIIIWDVTNKVRIGEPLRHDYWVTCVAFSPDGQRIASGCQNKWSSCRPTTDGHQATVYSVAYSPNGQYIVSGSRDGTIRIWDSQSGAPVGQPQKVPRDWVYCVTYSPDSRYIVSSSDDLTFRVWNIQTGALVGRPYKGLGERIESLACSPNSDHFVAGSQDGTVQIWDTENGAPDDPPYGGHIMEVESVACSPNGRYIASGSLDKTVRIWDAETGAAANVSPMEHADGVTSVTYSPDGRYILSGSRDQTIRAFSIWIWDALTGMPVGQPLIGHTSWVSTVACSPDSRYIVSGSHDKTVRIWDLQTGAPVGEPLTGHTDDVNCVAYSPDGLQILSCSSDYTIRLWDAQTGLPDGQPIRPGWSNRLFDVIYSASYSPDGRYIVTGVPGGLVQVWDIKTVAYSPDGRHVDSGCADRSIRVWDAPAPTEPQLRSDVQPVLNMAGRAVQKSTTNRNDAMGKRRVADDDAPLILNPDDSAREKHMDWEALNHPNRCLYSYPIAQRMVVIIAISLVSFALAVILASAPMLHLYQYIS
ncbi:WD40 repeat-like protein [Serendipita vermifera]|nr:WD40 repeat-like protein [Serendipita vermifera]